jgi:hypothetical protein
MVHDKWSLQQGRDLNSRPLGHESSPLPLDHGVLPTETEYLISCEIYSIAVSRWKKMKTRTNNFGYSERSLLENVKEKVSFHAIF